VAAVIAAGAVLGTGVDVGPHAVIDANVVLGDGCRIGPHVYLTGHTRIGAGTVIHAGAVIGDVPQDLHFDGSVSHTAIGSHCILREHVTVHRGAGAGTTTVIGDQVMLMAGTHVAHNCRIGNHVIVANASLLGGHVEVQDRAFLSGLVAVHQFVRIGTLAMVGGMNRLTQDIPPYCLFQEQSVQGVNVVGLRRAGCPPATRSTLRRAVKIFFFAGLNRPSAVRRIREECEAFPEIEEFLRFVEGAKRGITRGRGTAADVAESDTD